MQRVQRSAGSSISSRYRRGMSESPRRYDGTRSGTASPSRASAIEGIFAAVAVALLILILTPLLPDSNIYAPVLAAGLVIAGLLIARRLRR